MGLKWYCMLVMPLSYYPGTDDHNHANQLQTISPSVPPADHLIPIPAPSPCKGKMLTQQTSQTKGNEKEKNGRNIGGHLMDLPEDGSEDGISTPAQEEAGTMPLVLATAPGNRQAVQVQIVKTGRFGSRSVQYPDTLPLGGPNTDLNQFTCRFCRVWLDPSVIIPSSPFRVFLFTVAFRYPTVNCKILTKVPHCHFLMY